MITLIISLISLIGGYFIYGRFVEEQFGIDDNRTAPAVFMTAVCSTYIFVAPEGFGRGTAYHLPRRDILAVAVAFAVFLGVLGRPRSQ